MAVLDLDARAAKLGIDLSQVDFDSVLLPPGENFGIERYVYILYMNTIYGLLICLVFDMERYKQVDIRIFDVKSGRLMRGFQGSADEFSVEGYSVSWPVFKWDGGRDDKYFARLRKNTISVYETATFSLIDKRSIKVDNVVDICWSPTDSILAFFVPELDDGNQLARVCLNAFLNLVVFRFSISLYLTCLISQVALVQLPSKVEIRQKNLFNVSDCKMYWQSNGDYLAVKVDRYGSKSKKSIESGFEIFRVKEKDIPVEVLELDNKKDKIIEFAWEPKGQRFAVIHGDLPRPDVSFYSMRTPGRVSKLVTLKAKQANALFWSPTGKHMVLADRLNGKLEFYNVDMLMTMATVDNFMATDIKWDPTGRYLATVVTSSVVEDGFYIWSLYGKLLYRTLKEQVFQFAWRPRPPSLLSEQKEKEVKRNLRQYVERYEEEDEDVLDLLSRQEEESRRVMEEDWEMWINEWKKLHEEEKLQKQNLLGKEEEGEEEYCYETVEELIDVCEEVVSLEP
ncbi:eukaryotic translation initiation factor 3 subunit B-like [Raphanus sativus]|uniref:Eukaryotic translation initiation factor 3 subunit B n=1 Tax=Raphanus sativus TaxID=3726 RepID=A0A9W3DR35_RAPSA|nr:eukaryotic translation initiation factor 3 subunit B-like [Raphanus sativus]